MRITETAAARAHFTPESARLFRDSTLSSRIGRSTVAGSLNDQVRFRFDRDGAPSTWALVPDNELSARLLASPAGTQLEQRLRAVLATVDRGHDRSTLNLHGIMLSPTPEAWGAGLQLITRDDARQRGRTTLTFDNADAYAAGRAMSDLAGAQSLYGWVHISPEVARNMLTSVGAYSPAPHEAYARSGLAANATGSLLGHELEHRVSEADFSNMTAVTKYAPFAWIEEGTATLLEMQDARQSGANDRAWGISPQRHAGHVAARDSFDVGWKPFVGNLADAWAEFAPTAQANYVDSLDTLRGLLRLAGVDRRTNAGRERIEQLLQDAPVTEVPERLAREILKAAGLRATRPRVQDLAEHVLHANAPGGLGRVEQQLERLVARSRG